MDAQILTDPDRLEEKVAKGLVSKSIHPSGELFIYNYTPKVQYDRLWDDVTIWCRGLILDSDYNVIARPFPKFFNYGEVELPPSLYGELGTIASKEDGSLGIIYHHNDSYHVATRGSFASTQAIWASEYLKENYGDFTQPEGVTTLFEIIYPENRIVVDYKGFSGLILLGAVNNSDGVEFKLQDIDWFDEPRSEIYGENQIDKAHQLATSDDFNEAEGVVVSWHFPDKPTYRLKIKHPEYVRLHKIMTNLNSNDIYEHVVVDLFYNLSTNALQLNEDSLDSILNANLSIEKETIETLWNCEGKSLEALLVEVPDEFYNWVSDLEKLIVDSFYEINIDTVQIYVYCIKALRESHGYDGDETQRSYYSTVGRHLFKDVLFDLTEDKPEYRPLVFGYLDGKNIIPRILKMIKPPFSKPFEGAASED